MTKQPVQNKRFRTYDDLIKHTEQPLQKRTKLKIGRHGAAVIPRKFHLSPLEIVQLTAEWRKTKRFPNPHNRGFYFYLIEALITLGIDQKHPMVTVTRQIEALMSDNSTADPRTGKTAWNRFTEKEPRNLATGRDWCGRVDQNVLILQRLTGLTPYGRRLLDVGQKVISRKGAVIDVLVDQDKRHLLRLNTRNDRPVNEAKMRGLGTRKALVAEHPKRNTKVTKAS